jgi:HAD superfamily phosphoserine phosphatase-like hydrolase
MSGPIVVSDMDGTVTAAEAWRGIQAWVTVHHPSMAARLFLPVRLPMVALAKVGLADREAFRSRWVRDQARLLRGLSGEQLAAMGEWVVEHHLWPARRTAAIEAVTAALAAAGPGAELLVATASYQPVGEAFGRRIGASAALGTPLELRDGIATGAIAAPTQSGERKAAAIRARSGNREIAVAFGDTAGDIPLLSLARRAVAVAPDAVLRRAALERGWEILEGA